MNSEFLGKNILESGIAFLKPQNLAIEEGFSFAFDFVFLDADNERIIAIFLVADNKKSRKSDNYIPLTNTGSREVIILETDPILRVCLDGRTNDSVGVIGKS